MLDTGFQTAGQPSKINVGGSMTRDTITWLLLHCYGQEWFQNSCQIPSPSISSAQQRTPVQGEYLPLQSAFNGHMPSHSASWPVGILPDPCTTDPFPAALAAGLCTTHARFHQLPASPGHQPSENRQQLLLEAVLTLHLLEVFIWHC